MLCQQVQVEQIYISRGPAADESPHSGSRLDRLSSFSETHVNTHKPNSKHSACKNVSCVGTFWIPRVTWSSHALCCNMGRRRVKQHTKHFQRALHPPRPLTHLELRDCGVADLSSGGCVFTSIESFHFVVQLPHKVDLQGAGAWGGVQRESCTVRSAKGGKSVIVPQQWWRS